MTTTTIARAVFNSLNPNLEKITIAGLKTIASRRKGGFKLEKYHSSPLDGDFYTLVFHRDASHLDVVVDSDGNVSVACGATGTLPPKHKDPKQPRSGIIYRGPSQLDGSPIVVVAIYTGSNSKTGQVLQTYILADNAASPIENVRTGADFGICGDCGHRGYGDGTARSCYVNLGQGPRAVADGIVRGIYPDATEWSLIVDLGADRVVRLGTYGDPAAVPQGIWQWLLLRASAHTGYTHQWRNPAFASLASILMASADDAEEATLAQAMGWRTFRVRTQDEPTLPKEFVCPASAEAGRKVTCAQCRACDGNKTYRKGNPVIIAHGSLASRFVNRKKTIMMLAVA